MNYTASQAEEDFSKARSKALFNEIFHFLSPEEARLISLNDVKQLIKPVNETYVGMKVIPVEKIVGSEGRYNDFDNRFLPKSAFLRNRWERVDDAAIHSIDLPPIKVYEIAGFYFVRDGNHRVSVAKSRGVEFIDAEIVSLQSEIVLKKPDSIKDIVRQIINYEKRVFYAETCFGDITDYWCLDFSVAGKYDVIYNHILTHKYYMDQWRANNKPENSQDCYPPSTMNEAVLSWFQNVYFPIVSALQKHKALKKFPKRTLGDLYVWTVKYWDELKQKFGEDVPIDEAVVDFTKTYKLTFKRRILNKIKQILLVKDIEQNSFQQNESKTESKTESKNDENSQKQKNQSLTKKSKITHLEIDSNLDAELKAEINSKKI